MEAEKNLNEEVFDQNNKNIDTGLPAFEEKEVYEKALEYAFMEKNIISKMGDVNRLDASAKKTLAHTLATIWIYAIMTFAEIAITIYCLVANLFVNPFTTVAFFLGFGILVFALIYEIRYYVEETKEKNQIATLMDKARRLKTDLMVKIDSDPAVREIYNKFRKD